MLLQMVYKTDRVNGVQVNIIAVSDGADGVDFILEPVEC